MHTQNALEKVAAIEVETARSFDNSGLTAEEDEFLVNFPEEKKKKAIWKVDIRLIPLLTLFYMVAYIDRANIGNAKIEGLGEDLNLTDSQYNTCLSIFFIPYVLLEVPSNYLLARFARPSTYMGVLMLTWGIVMTFTGIVQNFAGLFVTRFLLGVAEAGFFPGAVYLVSMWYLPNETQKRIALFYTASALSGAFSGLLAAGIAQMDGVGGQEGWRWIFILEGIATVVCAFVCYFFLIDSPSLSSRWLEPDEIRYLELRQRADPSRRAASSTKKRASGWKTLKKCLTDWQLYLQALIFWGNSAPNYGLKFTMPQIIKNMGFTSTNAQLMTVPPYCAGAISAYVSAIFADRISWRMPFLVGPLLSLIAAFGLLFGMAGSEGNLGPMYFGVVLACIGLYPINPCNSTWTLSNLAGPEKRAMGIGFMIAMGNVGGIAGSFIYSDKESPKYPTGFGASFGFAAAAIASCLTLEICYHTANKKRTRMTEDEVRAKYTDEQLDELGNKSPLFKYSL